MTTGNSEQTEHSLDLSSGEINVGGDIVGRDKNVFLIQIQQILQTAHNISKTMEQRQPIVASWFQAMGEALDQLTLTEKEYVTHTKEAMFRMHLCHHWLDAFNKAPQGDSDYNERNLSLLFRIMHQDARSYCNQMRLIVLQYHQAWDQYIATQRKVAQEWKATGIDTIWAEPFRQSVVSARAAAEERKISQENAKVAEHARAESLRRRGLPAFYLEPFDELVIEHDRLIDEFERGIAFLDRFLSNLDRA